MSAQEIRLLGPLGKRYGRSHRVHLDTKTPAEAMRWLLANFPDARQFFAGASDRGVEFAVFRGSGEHRENIGFEQLTQPGGDRITFAPIHVGSKAGGVLQVIAGAVLIVVGGFISGWTMGAGSGVGGALMGIGISMVAGGVIQMLSPQPRLNKQTDSSQNQASDIFNGPVNTTAQGNCVPVLYGGPMEIGSAVISARIDAMDYSARPSNVGLGTAGGNTKLTPYDPD
ncbi:tail assembly protein [Luteibacter sp. PPL552]